MDSHDKHIIHSSQESAYRTPGDCYQALDREFHFVLDAAADADNHLAPNWMGPDSTVDAPNALLADWTAIVEGFAYYGQKAIFINPPFSKTLLNAYNTGRTKVAGQWVEHEKNPEKAKAYDIANWAEKCWEESRKGATIVGIFPFTPQTDWYRRYVFGHGLDSYVDPPPFHAAIQERRLPHRISFLQPDGTPTGNAGVNSAILVWKPNPGIVGPWQPHQFYWSYR